MDALRQVLLEAVGWQGESEGLFLARERHLDAIRRAEAERRLPDRPMASAAELFAEHLRQAQACLSEITGEFSADDLLGGDFQPVLHRQVTGGLPQETVVFSA